MARWVVGDIHGRIRALRQVLERSGFNYESDLLICVGDVVDRGEEPFECMAELLKIKNRVLILGNHDMNFMDYIATGHDGFVNSHGVSITKFLWKEANGETKAMVMNFFKEMVPYYIDEQNNIFTHGGFNKDELVSDQMDHVFAWDRELFTEALSCKNEQKLKTKNKFNLIFIGHSPTLIWKTDQPIFAGGVINLDTGAGFDKGRLTMMNVDTKQFIQSDLINSFL